MHKFMPLIYELFASKKCMYCECSIFSNPGYLVYDYMFTHIYQDSNRIHLNTDIPEHDIPEHLMV